MKCLSVENLFRFYIDLALVLLDRNTATKDNKPSGVSIRCRYFQFSGRDSDKAPTSFYRRTESLLSFLLLMIKIQ